MSPDFDKLADDLIAQVNAATLTPATEVTLVYLCEDEKGKLLPPHRASMTPTTIVRRPGLGRETFSAAKQRQAIIANINSSVRSAREKPLLQGGKTQRVIGFELEIRNLGAPI